MNLREHQRQDINRIREAFAEHRRVLYVLPTGAGKTVVAVALIRAWVKQGKRVLFLAHRRELIHQAYDQLVAAGVPKKRLGVLMAFDERANPRAMVQVASVATLNRRTNPEADVVVVDEAHHAVASSYSRVMKALPEAQVLGLTATPVRLDGKGLARAFDVLVPGAKSSELIAAGHLAEVETWTVPDELLPELKTVRVIAGDYQLNELATVMTRRQLVGGLVDHWQRHAEGRATVVFAVTIEHARVVRDAFESAGVKAEHVDMSTPREERDGILERLASGETQVITNCAVLLEGWDAPQIKCVMMARPTMSVTLYLQMAGRCVRPWRDSAPVLLDHAGNAVMHGPPQEDHEWELTQTKRKRGAVRKHMARACPECQRVLPLLAKACPCGHEFRIEEPPEEAEGELVQMVELTPLHCAACGCERTRVRYPNLARFRRQTLCQPCGTIRARNPEMSVKEIAVRRREIDASRVCPCGATIRPSAYGGSALCLDCRPQPKSRRGTATACVKCGKRLGHNGAATGCCRSCFPRTSSSKFARNHLWKLGVEARGQSVHPKRTCVCGAPLGKRNRSGRCQSCWSAAGWVTPAATA